MADTTLGAEIVTPEGVLYAGPAVGVVAATSEGDLTIMADHAELIGDVVPGVVTVDLGGDDQVSVLVHGGFIQATTAPGAAQDLIKDIGADIRSTRVTVLAGIAELVTEIDQVRAESARVTAEARVTEARAAAAGHTGDDVTMRNALIDLSYAEAELARAELRLATSTVLH